MATREEFKEVVRELVKEEVARLMGENQPSVFRKVLAAAPEIAEAEEGESEITEDMLPGAGGFKKRLRKKGGKLVVVRRERRRCLFI